MSFEVVDGYLLGRGGTKADVVAALLAERSDAPAAAPFYRALEAVGARAADEAFIALRLVLAGGTPDDDAVRSLRALSNVARAASANDASALASTLRRERSLLGALADMPVATPADRAALARAADAAFGSALGDQSTGERNAERDKLR